MINMVLMSGFNWKTNSAPGVASITPSGSAFAALRSDRQVVTWGDPSFGGYSNSVQKDGLLFPVTRGPRWAKMGQDGPRWAKMGQNGPSVGSDGSGDALIKHQSHPMADGMILITP